MGCFRVIEMAYFLGIVGSFLHFIEAFYRFIEAREPSETAKKVTLLESIEDFSSIYRQ
jgi:hypothetical protein